MFCARYRAPRPAEDGPSAARRAFFGSGVTLGSDDVPSTVIPDPSMRPADEEEQETAIRNLTFWKDGFSIEDGPLMEYENEQNKRILDAINNGYVVTNCFRMISVFLLLIQLIVLGWDGSTFLPCSFCTAMRLRQC